VPAPDVAVSRVAVPLAAVAGVPLLVVVTLAERSGAGTSHAAVTVSGGATPVTSRVVRVYPRRSIRVGVVVTPRAGGRLVLTARAVAARDADRSNDAAVVGVRVLDAAVAPSRPLVEGFAGFGAQFNHHVYAGLSRDAGVSDDNVSDMEEKVTALRPQLVRLFFTRTAFADRDRMQSFVRTAQLAQRTGATINVTWQTSHGSNLEVELPLFADVLASLVLDAGVSNLRWVTLQNEVNRTSITMETYDRMYRIVASRIAERGLGHHVRLMGGDLVEQRSPLGQTQGDWLRFLAARMSDVVHAYSIHVYWNHWSPGKIERRLREVRALYDTLPPETRKPLYVTEFGARGHRVAGDGGPGTWDDGSPLEANAISAFQHAWLKVLASKLGYAGAIKWDAFFGRYDARPQSYHLIGPPQEGWPLRPGYHLTRLLTGTTRAGWRTVAVDGASGTRLIAAFAGGLGELTVVGLDTTGAKLNAASPALVPYSIGGLPPRTTFRLLLWNGDGAGATLEAAPVTADATGIAVLSVPLHAVFALTTLQP
jgi:hypothetical protein